MKEKYALSMSKGPGVLAIFTLFSIAALIQACIKVPETGLPRVTPSREYTSTLPIETALPAPTSTPEHPYPLPYATRTPPPYPIPDTPTSPPIPTETIPTPTPSEPETPPLPSGKAITLFQGDIWLVQPGHTPVKMTHYDDVSVIFGWNNHADKILFGRGKLDHGDYGDTADLYVYDVMTSRVSQLTAGSLVFSAQ